MTGPTQSLHIATLQDALSIRYNNRVYEQQAEGRDVIVLSLGEAFFDLPLSGIDDLEKPGVFHYTHTRGLPALRQEIAWLYENRYGIAVKPEEVITTAGSKLAMYMALASVIDPESEVVLLEPAWVSYSEQVRLCHGVPVSVPWNVPLRRVTDYITDKTRAVIVNNPNNPSGRIYMEDDWSVLHEIATRRRIFLISDEAYSDFVKRDEDFVSGAVGDPTLEHTIIANSLSKNLGISGWRLGYLIGAERTLDPILKLNQHLVTCAPSLPAFYVAKHFQELLNEARPQIHDVLRLRDLALAKLDRLGLSYMEGDSTFYIFVSTKPSRLGSIDFCDRLLDDYGVAAVPGVGYGDSCDSFIRVSIGTEPPERIEAGLAAISELVRNS